ncbi:MAG: hypothetical protein QOE92_60 [Chloroflexota bacterium]|nr:hypothetical protein [Chloroflexota bacterium]
MPAPKDPEAYYAALEGWQREITDGVRKLIRGAAPGTSEAIKWGQPVFSANGPVLAISPEKRYVNVIFWRGAVLTDPKGLLEGTGDRMRHVKVHPDKPVPTAALRALVKQAIVLNAELGDPTKRARR